MSTPKITLQYSRNLPPADIAAILENETQCWQATDYANYSPLYFSQWFQILSSLIGIILLITVLVKTTHCLRHLDKFFKNLICLACLFSILHNLFTIIIQVYHQISFNYFHDCERMIVFWHCELLRGPQYFFSLGLCFIQLVTLADRIFSSYKPEKYERGRQNLFYYYLVFVISLSLALTIYVFSSDITSQKRAYCSFTTRKTFLAIQNNYWILLGLNIFCCIGFFFLYYVNKTNIIRKTHNFNLNNHFQLRNNLHSLTLAIPLMYSSFIVNVASIIANNIIRAGIRYLVLADLAAKLEGVYFYPFHSWVIAFILLWFTKRRKLVKITPYDVQNSETGQTYFEQLKKQWKN